MNVSKSAVFATAMIAAMCHAGIKEDNAAARALFAAKDYAKAEKAYDKALNDYPDAAATDKADALLGKSASIRYGKGHTAAAEAAAVAMQALDLPDITQKQRQVASGLLLTYSLNLGNDEDTRRIAEEMIADPSVDARQKATCLMAIGHTWRLPTLPANKDLLKAIDAFDRVIRDFTPQLIYTPSGPYMAMYADAYSQKGACLWELGRFAEAGSAYAAYITYAATPGNTTNVGIQDAFAKISAKYMPAADYRAALEQMLNAIPVEGNTEILGKIKSELLKVK